MFDKSIKLSEYEVLDIYLREVEKDACYPEGVKYAINYRVKETGSWIVKIRVDNKECQGHHVHFDGKLAEFNFKSFEETIAYVLNERLKLNEIGSERNRDKIT